MGSGVTGAALQPLRADLTPERRQLVENLRPLFLKLDVGVRRYASRKHLDAATVTRYLNGTRMPDWSFLADVIEENAAHGHPVTDEVKSLLHGMYEQALLVSSPRERESQLLKDQLAEADRRALELKDQANRLSGALSDGERRLADLESRLNGMARDRDREHRSHTAVLELWQDRYQALRDERDRLLDQIDQLQRCLAKAEAEAVAAEQQCVLLEEKLDQADAGGRSQSVLQVLEDTPRSAPVGELVRLVADLQTARRQPLAMDLVQTALEKRPAADAPGILMALDEAGLSEHARIALPAIVMVRPIDEVAGLALALHAAGLDTALVLTAAARARTPEDQTALAEIMHASGLEQLVTVLTAAVAVDRPVAHVVEFLSGLCARGMADLVAAAVPTPAEKRNGPELVSLMDGLRSVGQTRLAERLRDGAGELRSASEIARLVASLESEGRFGDARNMLETAATSRSADHVAAIVVALRSAGFHDLGNDVLHHAVGVRPAAEIAALIVALHGIGAGYDADAMAAVASRCGPDTVAAVFHRLDTHPGMIRDILGNARTYSASDIVRLVTALDQAMQGAHARFVLDHTLAYRPARYAAEVVRLLHEGGRPSPLEPILIAAARDMQAERLARFIDELQRVGLADCTGPLVPILIEAAGRLPAERLPQLLAELRGAGLADCTDQLASLLIAAGRGLSAERLARLIGELRAMRLGDYAEQLVTQARSGPSSQFDLLVAAMKRIGEPLDVGSPANRPRPSHRRGGRARQRDRNM